MFEPTLDVLGKLKISTGVDLTLDQSYLLYARPNAASDFVRDCFANQKVLNTLNRLGENRQSSSGEVKHSWPVSILHIPLDSYRSIHGAIRDVEKDHMTQTGPSMAELMGRKGIASLGSTFFKDPTLSSASLIAVGRGVFLDAVWSTCGSRPELVDLCKLADYASSSFPNTNDAYAAKGLPGDLLELLHRVRNLAVHGDLDNFERTDNQVCCSARILLDGILENFPTARP